MTDSASQNPAPPTGASPSQQAPAPATPAAGPSAGITTTTTPPGTAAPHSFAELQNGSGTAGGSAPLSALYDLDMQISVELGRTSMTVRDLLALSRGAVVQLDRLAGEPVDIFVGERKMAEGEVVVLGEHFGVRLTRVLATPATQVSGP